jgi:hypothetical protein
MDIYLKSTLPSQGRLIFTAFWEHSSWQQKQRMHLSRSGMGNLLSMLIAPAGQILAHSPQLIQVSRSKTGCGRSRLLSALISHPGSLPRELAFKRSKSIALGGTRKRSLGRETGSPSRRTLLISPLI